MVNAITGQDLAVVSEVKGTTTDPVQKAMELLPVGPVVIIDTPGIDDEGSLGELRINKTRQILNKTDVAVLVVDKTVGMTSSEEEMIKIFKDKKIPYIVVYNKQDLPQGSILLSEQAIDVSAKPVSYTGVKRKNSKAGGNGRVRKKNSGRYNKALRLCGAGGAH